MTKETATSPAASELGAGGRGAGHKARVRGAKRSYWSSGLANIHVSHGPQVRL